MNLACLVVAYLLKILNRFIYKNDFGKEMQQNTGFIKEYFKEEYIKFKDVVSMYIFTYIYLYNGKKNLLKKFFLSFSKTFMYCIYVISINHYSEKSICFDSS